MVLIREYFCNIIVENLHCKTRWFWSGDQKSNFKKNQLGTSVKCKCFTIMSPFWKRFKKKHTRGIHKEGCWEPYSKYIELSYFSHFLSMQETNKYLPTIVALYQSFKATIVSRCLCVSCILRNWLQWLYSMYLKSHPTTSAIKQQIPSSSKCNPATCIIQQKVPSSNKRNPSTGHHTHSSRFLMP